MYLRPLNGILEDDSECQRQIKELEEKRKPKIWKNNFLKEKNEIFESGDVLKYVSNNDDHDILKLNANCPFLNKMKYLKFLFQLFLGDVSKLIACELST